MRTPLLATRRAAKGPRSPSVRPTVSRQRTTTAVTLLLALWRCGRHYRRRSGGFSHEARTPAAPPLILVAVAMQRLLLGRRVMPRAVEVDLHLLSSLVSRSAVRPPPARFSSGVRAPRRLTRCWSVLKVHWRCVLCGWWIFYRHSFCPSTLLYAARFACREGCCRTPPHGLRWPVRTSAFDTLCIMWFVL